MELFNSDFDFDLNYFSFLWKWGSMRQNRQVGTELKFKKNITKANTSQCMCHAIISALCKNAVAAIRVRRWWRRGFRLHIDLSCREARCASVDESTAVCLSARIRVGIRFAYSLLQRFFSTNRCDSKIIPTPRQAHTHTHRKYTPRSL